MPSRSNVSESGHGWASQLPITTRNGRPNCSNSTSVSGAPAAQYVDGLTGRIDVEVLGPAADGSYLVRAADVRTLCDALDETPRPGGRLRVAVDPVRL